MGSRIPCFHFISIPDSFDNSFTWSPMEQYTWSFGTTPQTKIQEENNQIKSLFQIFLTQDSYVDIDTLLNEKKGI